MIRGGKNARGLRAAAAALFVALPLLVSTAQASGTTAVLGADADAFVQSSRPTSKKGLLTFMRVRQGTKLAYVRFVVPASAEPIASATLRIYATTASKCSAGVEILRAANDTWVESTITWANQPGSVGTAIDTETWSAAGSQSFDVSAAVTGGGPVSFVLRHSPACNAQGDVIINSREASADRPELVVETGGPPAPAACGDGLDNDGDGLVDHPADPGCVDSADTDETDEVPAAPACSDGLDNDVDGLVDHPADPGCADGTDTDELHVAPAPADAETVMAAGDIVCDPSNFNFGGANPAVCQHRATLRLLAGGDAVLTLGDLQYSDGALDEFTQGYDLSWGQYASSTYPAPGNHEYKTLGAQGYFDYWTSKLRPTGDRTAGYYSFDLGAWHVVSLNSVCAQVPCSEGSLQNDWLEQDLAATTQPCIAAYWHHPLFNSGTDHGAHAPSGAKAFWNDLYAAGADLVLNGHEHNYQRYAKQDLTGIARTTGIREFVVGSGGSALYGMLDVKDPNYEVGNTTDFGVLRLHLGDGSYTWEFVGVGGAVLDAGGPVACN